MAREIYNFIWAPPAPASAPIPVAHHEANTINRPVASAKAVILFPSLLTPLVHVDSDQEEYLELLIAADKDLSKLPDVVNRQLKVSMGLDPHKPYDPRPLFGGGSCSKITAKQVGHVNAAGTEILKTESKFQGILHPSVGKVLSDQGLMQVYAVKVHKSCLPTSSPGNSVLCSGIAKTPPVVGYVYGDGGLTSVKSKEALVGYELSDRLIAAMLDRRVGKDDGSEGTKAGKIPGRCRYAFTLGDGSVDLTRADPSQPVQSYHPLVVFTPDEFTYASIGHFSDLHVNSRWAIVGKSPARVIEYRDADGHDAYLDESPQVGALLAQTSASVQDVMSHVFGSDASLVVIGGDLIDHIRNAYEPKTLARRHALVKDVWDAVDLDKRFTEQTYPYGIDLVAFYSLVLDAIRSSKKPAFGISGNHDCYVKPFGISPRLRSTRANEGIPADLNMTFYEALLAFGPTGGLLTKVGSSFDKDWFEWFYMVFSPFNDWWHKLPKQSLVGLGWGTGEDILGPGGDQGVGHLPRSKDGVSGPQLGLLQAACNEHDDHKVTLTTHFTFLSYKENIPMRTKGEPTPGVLESGYKNKYEYGTFESSRGAVLGMLNEKKIECVLTGHSHRRGTYLLLPGRAENAIVLEAGGDGVNVASAAQTHGAAAAPAIVVSDSAGPYPRHNLDGEFVGWGSDRPGGTLVTFDPGSGHVSRVQSLQASSRPIPRAAVSLDYLDIMHDKDGYGVFVGNTMVVQPVTPAQNSGAWGKDAQAPLWYVNATLTDFLKGWQVRLTKLVFAYDDPTQRKWVRVEASASEIEDTWVVPKEQTDDFRRWLTSGMSGFVSAQLATGHDGLARTYDWSSHWNFEAVPTQMMDPGAGGSTQPRISYLVARPSNNKLATTLTLTDTAFREVPNFAWRQTTLAAKYDMTSL